MGRPAYERESILDAARRIVRQYERAVRRATIRSRRFIRDLTHRRDLATSARRREEAYSAVGRAFEAAAEEASAAMESEARAHVDAVSRDAARDIAAAQDADDAADAGDDGGGTAADGAQPPPTPPASPRKTAPHPMTRDEFVTALNGDSVHRLVATATDRMGRNAIRHLRQSFVDVYRRAQIEGWTANELHKALQERWDELAGDEEAYRFVDRAGRRWSNARYIQMAVRTTMARLTREAFLKECVAAGIDVVRVSEDAAEVCEVCRKWRGQYLSITGATAGFPTLADAQGDGLFHPNCIHRLEYVTKRELRRLMAEREGKADARHREEAAARRQEGAAAPKQTEDPQWRLHGAEQLERRVDRALDYDIDPATNRPRRMRNIKADFGPVPAQLAERIRAISGVDVSGFHLVFRAYDIRHIDTRHGPPRVVRVWSQKEKRWKNKKKGEQEAGQMPLSRKDILALPGLCLDGVGIHRDNEQYGDGVVVRRRHDGNTTFIVLKFDKKRKAVYIKTAYRKGKAGE